MVQWMNKISQSFRLTVMRRPREQDSFEDKSRYRGIARRPNTPSRPTRQRGGYGANVRIKRRTRSQNLADKKPTCAAPPPRVRLNPSNPGI
jgi:hypothetical protein